MRCTVFGVALLAVGCGAAQHFDATERATATSPRGDVAAEYEVGDPGSPTAEVKVWMSGAYKRDVAGREMTVIEVVFDVENNGTVPIQLTDVVLDSARASGVSFEDQPPFRTEGDRVVAANDEGTLRAYFAIPDRYDPEDIARIEVGWELHHATGTYTQRTPFRQAPEPYAGYYPYPYPYLYYDFPYPHISYYDVPFARRSPGAFIGTIPP